MEAPTERHGKKEAGTPSPSPWTQKMPAPILDLKATFFGEQKDLGTVAWRLEHYQTRILLGPYDGICCL